MARIRILDSLHTKWLLMVNGLIVASVLLSGAILIDQSRRVIYRNIFSNTHNTAQMATVQIRQEIDKLYTDLRLLATTPSFLQFDASQISTTLKNQLMQNIFAPDEYISVVKSDNKEIANNQLTGQHPGISTENYFTDKIPNSRPFYSGRIKWKNRLPYWTIGAFVNGWEDRGCVLADISLRRFWAVTEQLVVGSSGYAYIVFKDGQLIAHPQRKLVINGTSLEKSPPFIQMLKNQNGDLEYRDENGVLFLCSYAYIPELGFGVIVQAPAKDFHSEILMAVSFSAVVLMLIIILSSVISILSTRKMINPITDLSRRSIAIAEGELDNPIPQIKSKDEIGVLASNFESMRFKLKQHTDHLQELVVEKVRQNQDILSNIEQGLFTVNFDGTINAECSSITEKMLDMGSLNNAKLEDVFRFNDDIKSQYLQWLKLAEFRYKNLDWKKIVRLCPVREMQLEKGDHEKRVLSFDYQRMFDLRGNLKKIMVLVQDITEQRKMEQVIEEQRLIHENEVNTILSIAKNPPELLTNFIRETEKRIEFVRSSLKKIGEEYEKMRNANTGKEKIDNEVILQKILRFLHTIKGDAGSCGFDLISKSAHESEQILDEMSKESLEVRRSDYVNRAVQDLQKLQNHLNDSKDLISKMTTDTDVKLVKLTQEKVDRIRMLISGLGKTDSIKETLLQELITLDYRPLSVMALKYKHLVERLNSRLHKKVIFETYPADIEIPPDLLSSIDEALTHLIRNSMDHGIEEPEIRAQKNRQQGKIEILYEKRGNIIEIRLKDNGQGIDTEKIVKKAIEKGIIRSEEVVRMSENEKVDLIFHQGLSSSDSISEISGRGIGMVAVAANLHEINGTIDVWTEKDIGTEFLIKFEYPVQHSQKDT